MRQSFSGPKKYNWISLFLLLIILVISFLTFSDYSSCWDQFFHVEYGKSIINWYISSFTDNKAITGEGIAYNIKYYGGLFDLISTVFSNTVPFINDYLARRIMIFLAGLSGVFFSWKIGKLLYGPKVGLFCAISIITIPMYYGHMFFNPKDIPFAAAYIASIYFIIKIILDLPSLKKMNIVLLSFAIGFAAGVRISGLVAVMYLFVALILYNILIKKFSALTEIKRISIYKIVWIIVFVSIISFAVAISCWPYLLTNPLRLFDLGAYITNFNGMENRYIFTYIWNRLNLQLPELHVVLLYLSVLVAIIKTYSLYKNRSSISKEMFLRSLGVLILLMSVVFPLIVMLIKSTPLYNELRQILFIIPPLSCLLAITFDVLMTEEKYIKYIVAAFFSLALVSILQLIPGFIENRGIIALLFSFVVISSLFVYFSRIFININVLAIKKIIFIVVMVSLCRSLFVMYELHPYEYTYFNKFTGGASGALLKGYDSTDYWLISYKETLDKLKVYLKKRLPGVKVRLGVCTMPVNLRPYLGNNMILETDPDKMDFFIYTERAYACHPYDYFKKAQLVVETKRSNVKLGGVLDVRRSKNRFLPKDYKDHGYKVNLRIRTLITNNPNLSFDITPWTVFDKKLLIPDVNFPLSDALYNQEIGFFPIFYHNSFVLEMDSILLVKKPGLYKVFVSADNAVKVSLNGMNISELQVREQFDSKHLDILETKEVEVFLAKGKYHLNIIYTHIPESLIKIIAKYRKADQEKYFMVGQDSEDIKFMPY